MRQIQIKVVGQVQLPRVKVTKSCAHCNGEFKTFTGKRFCSDACQCEYDYMVNGIQLLKEKYHAS
jgi:hypothetical protein